MIGDRWFLLVKTVLYNCYDQATIRFEIKQKTPNNLDDSKSKIKTNAFKTRGIFRWLLRQHADKLSHDITVLTRMMQLFCGPMRNALETSSYSSIIVPRRVIFLISFCCEQKPRIVLVTRIVRFSFCSSAFTTIELLGNETRGIQPRGEFHKSTDADKAFVIILLLRTTK